MGSLPSGAGALVGKRLGQYELLALLALGGTAEIYLARIDGTAGFEKYVVVKCLHDHLAYDREFVQMFLDEARLGAQLDHSNCVQTLGLGEQDGRYYLVMEYVVGMSLALMARRATERVPRGYIPVPLVLGMAVQACEGLHYAHERTSSGKPLNLVHRDISPQNLVVTFEGVVKIVDFGIAKAEERETATRSGTIKGKFAYMSPEQCQAKDIDRRTDVFALGVVVHELLTGRRLFKRQSAYDTYQAILECKVPAPSAQNHELDPALDPIILKALAKNPSQRYPSAEAFGEALTHYLHTRGKASGAGDIALFIDQYYGPELGDHGARMRELLAGRTTAASGWDEGDDASDAASLSAVEVSQFEVIGDDTEGVADDDDGDDEGPTGVDDSDLPAESTRIEMNPTAKLAELDERVRRSSQQQAVATPPVTGPQPVVAPPRTPTPPPVAPPRTPTPPPVAAAAPAKTPVPVFGAATPGGSIFGGPPGGIKAGPLPVAPEPEKKELPSLFGGPSKLAPKAAPGAAPPGAVALGTPRESPAVAPGPALAPPPPRPDRSKSQTEPAPIPGATAPKPFGGTPGAAVVPTVLAEPEPTPSSRSFASAPEAKTMAMDNGFVAGALAELRAQEEAAKAAQAAAAGNANNVTAPGRKTPAPMPHGEDGPTTLDLGYHPTVPAMDAVAPPRPTPPPATSSPPLPPPGPASPYPTTYPSAPLSPYLSPSTPPPSWPPAGHHPPPQQHGQGAQPYPSGELLVPPHGTPPGTMPSQDSLPMHLMGFPQQSYPVQQQHRQPGWPEWTGSSQVPLMRRLPPWVLTAVLLGAIALITGLIIAIARAAG